MCGQIFARSGCTSSVIKAGRTDAKKAFFSSGEATDAEFEISDSDFVVERVFFIVVIVFPFCSLRRCDVKWLFVHSFRAVIGGSVGNGNP